MGAMGKIISTLSLPAMLALIALLSSCAMGDTDALDQLFQSEETLFVASGINNNIYISRDGIVWTTPLKSVAGGGYFNASAFGSGGFLVAGLNASANPYAAFSRDGFVWAPVYSVSPGTIPRAVLSSGDAFVMTTDQGILYSPTGTSWSMAYSAPTSNLSCIAQGDGVMMAAGFQAVLLSMDGINWRMVSNPTNMNFYDVVFVNGTFYAVGTESGNCAIYATRDGEHAVGNLITPQALEVYGIAHGNGTFVAVGENGYIWVSADGFSWSRIYLTVTSGSTIRDVTYGNGMFVAVTYTPSVIYSRDGVTWSTATPPSGGFNALETITVRP